MAARTVYGNTRSENGWPMVDQGSCEWITVPGTTVSLQIQKGQPLAILRAFAADFNAHVEPLRDPDSACWTATNSVSTSNHLSGTAMDLNWNGHDGKTFRLGNPEHVNFPPPSNERVKELLDFYEGMIFWGQRWSIQDGMHFQVGGNTYNNPKTQAFINRKIRPDGYSTFARVSKTDGYALAVIKEGQRRGISPRGIQIALATVLVESNFVMYANRSVPESLNIPHDAVGSDHDSVGLFQQRSPMWGPPHVLMDPTKSAGLFFDRLVQLDYNNHATDPGWYAAEVQRPAAQYRGRYQERMPDAAALYDRLVGSEAAGMSDDLSPSRSIYRTSDHPTMSLRDAVFGADACSHMNWVEQKALSGDPWAINLVAKLAQGELPAGNDPWAVDRARHIISVIRSAIDAQNEARKK